MNLISSAEISDLMLRQSRYLTISEITFLARAKYPTLTVTRNQVTNIVRHFMKSQSAHCELEPDSYPHRYYLHDVTGYQFRVRGRCPDFSRMLVKGTSKATRERQEQQNREVSQMAKQLMDNAVRRRRGLCGS